MSSIDWESENSLDNWLRSIEFQNEIGEILPIILGEDESEDPEGDRG